MEFSLGFFGGLGMGYAVLTRQWPPSRKPSRTGNWIALIFLFGFIPASNYFNGFSRERFMELAEKLHVDQAAQFASSQFLTAGLATLLFAFLAVWVWSRYGEKGEKLVKFGLPALLLITALHYKLFCYIRLGVFHKPFSFGNSETLYFFIVALLYVLWQFGLRRNTDFPGKAGGDESWKRWGFIMAALFLIFVLITVISIHIHPEMPGAHDRF
jgi:magnesium-transporting ATPase (P-type)